MRRAGDPRAQTPICGTRTVIGQVGIVVIGRNGGERLVRCLESVREYETIVYVDSGSTDRSVIRAREMGAEIVELDTSRPFTAARGRNAGYQFVIRQHPDLRFIQFVDGDCELEQAWVPIARRELEQDDSLAIVCGQLRERHPDMSIYGLLCDLEWRKPIGDITYSGGIFMIRAAVFAQIKGFDPSVHAGEEPEFCSRIRAAGFRISRISAPMAIHDANMTRFSQWWNRNYRTGYGGLDIQHRFGQLGFSKINRSAWIWVLGWPALVFLATFAGSAVGGTPVAIACCAIAAAILPAQIARLAVKTKTPELSWTQSIVCASMTLLSKIAQVQGQLSWYLHHANRPHPKTPTSQSA